jgi:hypothetical protein
MFSIFSKKESKQGDANQDKTPQKYEKICVESDLSGEFVVLDRHIDSNPTYSARQLPTTNDSDDSPVEALQRLYADCLDEVSDNLRTEVASQYNGKIPERLTPAEVGMIQIKASRAAKATTDALEDRMKKKKERQKVLEPKGFTGDVSGC